MMMTVIPMHAFPFLQLFACLALLYLTLPYLTLPYLTHNQAPLTTSTSKEKKSTKGQEEQQASSNK